MNTWQDIYGHEQIKSDLQKLLNEQKLPHALLFSGSEGIGKLMVAKTLAKSLLCQQEIKTAISCNTCESCKLFDEVNHPDFYYLEPDIRVKKVLKIEQIRQMQANIALAPYLSDKRVVIINDAQYLNDAAANSLLKTLEEPVGEVFFILISSNKDMLLPTILSRCTKIHFAPLDCSVVERILSEKMQIEKNKAKIIANLSNGSMQKAIQFIDDNSLALRDKAINILEQNFSVKLVWSFLEEYSALEKKQIEDVFIHLQMLLRDLLMIYIDIESTLIYNRDKLDILQRLSKTYSQTKILNKLALVDEVIKKMATNADVKLILQKFILKWQEV